MIAGCGGGGSGGTESGQSLSGEYYPEAQGDTWSYDATSSASSSPYFDTIRVTGTATVLGSTATIFLEENLENSGVPIEEYYRKDSRGITYYGNNDPDDWINAALVPYDEMLFGQPLNALTLFNRMGVDTGRDLDADGVSERMDARAVVRFDQFEPLVTTAGSFSSVARVTATVNLDLHYSRLGTIPSVETITEWRSQNFGLLKQIYSAEVGGNVFTDTMDIRGLRVNGVGAGYLTPQVLAPDIARPISDAFDLGRHAVGTDGAGFLLVTRQQTNIPNISPTAKWSGRIVLANGTVLPAFDMSSVDSHFNGEAAVAYDGSNYLAITGTAGGVSAPSGLYGQRVTPAGGLVDPAPGFSVAPGAISPAIAYGGGVYLIAYLKPAQDDVFGVVVQPPNVVVPEFTIHNGTGIIRSPSVAFDGVNFLIVWARSAASGTPETADIFAARVASDGTVLDSSIPLSTAQEAQDHPQVACDGANCLVLWRDGRNYPNGDMYGTRIDSNGTLLDGPADIGGIAVATGIDANAGYPGLAYTGTEYIAAWSRGAFVNNPGGPTGIYTARIATNGSVSLGASSTGVAVSGPPAAATRLYFVAMAGGSGGTLATWLNNSELVGSTKSVSGALIFPLITQ